MSNFELAQRIKAVIIESLTKEELKGVTFRLCDNFNQQRIEINLPTERTTI